MNRRTQRRAERSHLVAVLLVLGVVVAGCDWTSYRYGPEHTGANPTELAISAANVSTIERRFTARTGIASSATPVVSRGVVYLPGLPQSHFFDGRLYAFDAAGSQGCTGAPAVCSPLWSVSPVDISSTPAVVGGTIYIGAYDRLVAYDENRVSGCTGVPVTCVPMWQTAPSADASEWVSTSPTVAGGVVFVGTVGGRLLAFDAAGTTGCSGTPTTCQPLWSATVGTSIRSAPAVAGGRVYVSTGDGTLAAFDDAGTAGCSGSPVTCAPLWRANGRFSSPAVAGGRVYVSTGDGTLAAFDAAGSAGCTGTPTTCVPLWTGLAGAAGDPGPPPAVAGGRVFVGTRDGELVAFDAAGTTGCSGTPRRCVALWRGPVGAPATSPIVANGVVYVGSSTTLLAFDAAGASGCLCETCTPLLSIPAGGEPTIANGVVYTVHDDLAANGTVIDAFSLP